MNTATTAPAADRRRSAPDSVRSADPSRSELDPDWPPAPPPKGRAADVLQYIIENRIDAFY